MSLGEPAIAAALVGSFQVDAVRIGSTVDGHCVALINVYAGLSAEQMIPEGCPHALRVLTMEASGTGVALESGGEVDAVSERVTGVVHVALQGKQIQITN